MKKAIALILAVIACLSLVACGAEKVNYDAWPTSGMASILPQPETEKLEVNQYSSSVSVTIFETDSDAFARYIEQCKDAGFSVEAEQNNDSYTAFNTDGYKLSLSFWNYSAKIHCNLNSPTELGTLAWPSSGLAALLPAPNSDVGTVNQDSASDFDADVGEISSEAFAAYVEQCKQNGFTVDYDSRQERYSAENADGVQLTLEYRGFNIMHIDVEAADEPETTEQVSTGETEASTGATEASAETGGIRAEFKAAMDAYESFCTNYCKLVRDMNNNPTDLSLLTDYANMTAELAEMSEAFGAWGDEELSAEELAYYLDVSVRITEMLADAAAEIG